MSDKTELTREEVAAAIAGLPEDAALTLRIGDHDDECCIEMRSRVGKYTVADDVPEEWGQMFAQAYRAHRQLLATMDEITEARAALAALRGVVLDTQAAYGGGSLHEWTSCPFCGADGGWDDTMEGILHDAGCPWKHERDRKADAALATTEPPDAD